MVILHVGVMATACTGPSVTELADALGLCAGELAEMEYAKDLAEKYALDRDSWQDNRLEYAVDAAEANHLLVATLISLNENPEKTAEVAGDVYLECLAVRN